MAGGHSSTVATRSGEAGEKFMCQITALQSALEEAHAAKEVSVSSGQQQEEYQGLREELGRLQESVERYQAELQRREVGAMAMV